MPGLWGPLLVVALLAAEIRWPWPVKRPAARQPLLRRHWCDRRTSFGWSASAVWVARRPELRQAICTIGTMCPAWAGKRQRRDFFASDDPGTLTQIWIHGNQITHGPSVSGRLDGLYVVGSAGDERAAAAVCDLVLAERKVGGLLQDVREKAATTLPAAFHLARFIDAIGSDVHVGLTAYSFGGRIALGTLHLLGGGSAEWPERSPFKTTAPGR